MSEKIEQKESNWKGRSLANYVSQHPKAKGARTLTQAKIIAFGEKKKNDVCRCKQTTCRRLRGEKSSSC